MTAHNSGLLNSSVFDNVSASFLTNAPPVISWVVPANNSTFIQPKMITLTASATDADGTVSNLAFFSGTTLLGNVTNGVGQSVQPDVEQRRRRQLYPKRVRHGQFRRNQSIPRRHRHRGATADLDGVRDAEPTGSSPDIPRAERTELRVRNIHQSDAGWTPVWTNAPTNGVLTFTNANATDRSRFYRVSQ